MRWKRFKNAHQQKKNLEYKKSDIKKAGSSPHLLRNLNHNLAAVKDKIGFNSDVIIRKLLIGKIGIRASIVYVDGLADTDIINEHILKPLMFGFKECEGLNNLNGADIKDYIKNHIISLTDITEIQTLETLISKVLSGSTALLIDGYSEIFILGTQGWKSRSIEEPETEVVVRGPRVGFTETLRDNTALLRRYTLDPNLTMLDFQVGRRTRKSLNLVYIKDIAEPELVNEVKRRIEKIDTDDVPESGSIEQLIEDNFLSPFPQIQNTERPDRVIGAINEGRVAILLDGTPFALIAPVTFSMLLQSPEDYYERWIPASLTRALRFFAAIISLFFPAIYIAFISYHHGLMPTKLAISIAGTRMGVPYPSVIEALLMEIAIEILREAGIRLPRPVGQAIGIVGGLVIGEAAVQAGIISPIMVIIVAVTAISSFTIPHYGLGLSLRWLRFIAMIFAATLGLYGVILFFLMILIHFVKLKSFGVPYITPAVPYSMSDLKDFLFRMPLMMMKKRPVLLNPTDKDRKGSKDK